MLRLIAMMAIFLTCATEASANPSAARTFTLDGRLYNSTGLTSPLLDANVVINVKVLDPTGACVLYEEEQITSTYSTNGYFNIKVGSNTGNMKRTASDPNNSMAQVFQNYSLVPGSGPACAGYSPTTGDGRKVRITVSPSSGGTEVLSPDIEMDSVPMAIVAESVQGLDRSKLLQIGSGSLTQVNIANVFSTTNYPKLTSLLAGSSGDYVQVSSTTGASMPTYSGSPTAPAAGQVWLDTSSNQLKFHNGLTVQSLFSGTLGAGITSINGINAADQTLTVGTTGTAPAFSSSGTVHTLNVPMASAVGVTAGLISKTDYDKFNSTLPASLTDGYIFVGNGSNVATGVSPSGDVSVSNTGVFSLATTGVAAGTYPKVQVDSKGRVIAGFNLLAVDIPDLDAAKITTGTLASIRLPSSVILDGGNTIASGTLKVGTNSNHPMTLRANNLDYVMLDTSGNLGIGVVPTALLHARKDQGASTIIQVQNNSAAATAAAVVGATNSSGSTVMTTLGSGFTPAGIFEPNYGALATDVSLAGLSLGTQGAGDPLKFYTASQQRAILDGNGNFGVGTTTPSAKLEVNGEIKAGSTGLACANGTKGSMRYNDVSNVMEYCNGTVWTIMQSATCTDATPDVFAFTNLANQSASTLVSSNILQLNGINCSVTVSVSGSGAPALRICSDAACSSVVQDWTTATSAIISGQYLQLRQTTNAVGGVTNSATVIAGTLASSWNVATTGDCSGLPGSPPPIGTVCADGTIYAGLSADGNVPMYTTRCDLGQTWGGSTCTGAGWLQSWNNGAAGTTLLGYTNPSTGKSYSASLAALGGGESPYVAATNCENHVENGHSDWYLPARNELTTLYNNRAVIGSFSTTTNYWTSNENTASNGHYVRFSDGYVGTISKGVSMFVRCVRR